MAVSFLWQLSCTSRRRCFIPVPSDLWLFHYSPRALWPGVVGDEDVLFVAEQLHQHSFSELWPIMGSILTDPRPLNKVTSLRLETVTSCGILGGSSFVDEMSEAQWGEMQTRQHTGPLSGRLRLSTRSLDPWLNVSILDRASIGIF